ncbi:MAG: pyruvate, phosphate dikinase [Verrucomicrobia bacterium]|jgi:pyruvate, water dikinase|nr:pyruvate, phosphate dikinase [Verrucomicrobiota bacterium]
MSRTHTHLSTGLPGLDHVFRGLMPGDNIVWQVDSIEDYLLFVAPYVEYAKQNNQKLIYFRFAEHAPLISEDAEVDIRVLRPDEGFQPFLNKVHHTIDESGRGSFYLFDCLSELAPDWCSDRMLGNFFSLTCPYLYDHAAIAYFSILRNRHSFHATRPIASTTQIFVDAYRHNDRVYIHPTKVQHRHSATMHMLHAWEGADFLPLTESCVITEVLKDVPWSNQDSASFLSGYWSKAFVEAETIQSDIDRGLDCREDADRYFSKLLRMLISHDERVQRLAEECLTLRDLLDIRKRMIGTGLIGGKAVGMLLARAILKKAGPRWHDVIEAHDSFFVGSDVFYTYLVENGCWWMAQESKPDDGSYHRMDTARRRILAGEFPDYIQKQFADMLEYFGESPIIVRSSSLLEDNFGSAFAGKYESVFCANQGGAHKRLDDFLCAVRTVYASTMSEEALVYREQHGLANADEQMALLIQRVSGARYGRHFYPQGAGVGFSFNPYVWHESIDPTAGMLRLVFGVGTRAVDRSDDDYTRIVALNAPTRRPEANFDEMRQYAQRRVDVLDLEANHLTSCGFHEIETAGTDLPIEMFASEDSKREREMKERGRPQKLPMVLTFDKLLTKTDFVEDMRGIMDALQAAYNHHVDIEFTLNFFDPTAYKINIVQCRPLETRAVASIAEPPVDISTDDLVLRSSGAVIGRSQVLKLDWLIFVVPEVYSTLPDRDRYAVARLIDDITHHERVCSGTIMLIGPGRWGTTTPSLGVPVSFMDISPASVLCEIVAMHANLIPDVSLGTHFFNDLVENDMLYLAMFPGKEGHVLNREFLDNREYDRLADIAQSGKPASEAVRLIDVSALPDDMAMVINANTLNHRVVCYKERITGQGSA